MPVHHATFRAHERIIATVFASGSTLGSNLGPFETLRVRYFGPQPLIEDNSVSGASSLTFDCRVGYKWKKVQIGCDVLNVFDSKTSDIQYFYASRLPGEPEEGVNAIHLHPAEPRTVRLSMMLKF